MKPLLLAIMDGFGIAPAGRGNAISLANTPFLDKAFKERPNIQLSASGKDVGLPEGQMGNSEVGHLNMGAGRIVAQELTRIDDACKTGSLEKNEVLINAFDKAIKENRPIHFLGLLSDGGVHSNITHLEALIEMAAKRGSKDMRIHAFMDGRDVDPHSGKGYMQRIVDFGNEIFENYEGAMALVATISGRYYAMDRDKRWDRVQQAWNAICLGQGKGFARAECVRAVEASYSADISDEFIIPTVLDHRGVNDGDTVVFFNFRPDRARQLTSAFLAKENEFDGFDRVHVPDVNFVCMTEYDESFDVDVAFPKTYPENTLADYLASNGLTQYHTAETEKYAHVTFFFNGGIEEPKKGEQRCLIPSPKVATYDLQPEMSAPELTDSLEAAIKNDTADVYIVNYANCDMVGHTGVIDAAKKAAEAVDAGISRIVSAILEKGGAALVTADHGNAEKMLNNDGKAGGAAGAGAVGGATGAGKAGDGAAGTGAGDAKTADDTPWTAHTTNPVPLILFSNDERLCLNGVKDARLADIAPTFIDLLDIDKPVEWMGRSLLVRI